MTRSRILAIVVGAVALALTVFGVVVAATDSNPGATQTDPFHLNGYPPKNATMNMTLTTGNGATLHAVAEVDFRHNAVALTTSFPVVFTNVAINARWVKNELYVRNADATSAKWLRMPLRSASLFGVSLEMVKPDLTLLTGFDSVTSKKVGDVTTHTYIRKRMALSNVLTPSSQVGSMKLVVTTGRQGEVLSSTMSIGTGGTTTTLSAVVTSYNGSVSIVTPPAADVRTLPTNQFLRQLKGSPFGAIPVPSAFGQVA